MSDAVRLPALAAPSPSLSRFLATGAGRLIARLVLALILLAMWQVLPKVSNGDAHHLPIWALN